MDTNYGISMNSILRMDILHDARLLAGASGTDQIVTSVSVMVDPNIVSAVTGGELLVSTAYAIRENIPQLMQLVPQLKEHGVVGLGLKFNSYINEMPQNILDLCNELSFPLFEIPNSISFSQIITPIMTTIVNNQAQTLGDIYELQKALTATMLGGGNLQSIVQTLFDRFGNSVHGSHAGVGDDVGFVLGGDLVQGAKGEQPLIGQAPRRIISGQHGVVGRQVGVAVHVHGRVTARFADGPQGVVARTPESDDRKSFHGLSEASSR